MTKTDKPLATSGNVPATRPLATFGNVPATRPLTTPDSVLAVKFCNTTAPLQCNALTAAQAAARPHVCWLGGWGISEHDMLTIVQRLIPQASHRVFCPTTTSLEMLSDHLTALRRQAGSQPDNTASQSAKPQGLILGGYSTGAFLLLRELERFAPLFTAEDRLLLFAPFADFRAENGLGGRVVSTRLRLLLRRLRNDPLAALADFYHQSGIGLSPPDTLPYAAADLLWGIEQLTHTAVPATALNHLRDAATGMRISAWAGADDALIEASQSAALFTPGQCRVLPEATHDLASLLLAANAEGAFLP